MIHALLIAWGLLFFVVPARAAESDVTPELVCAVKSAVRPSEPAWSAEKCARVSNALLTSLAGDVQGWNRRSKGYAARIRALVAALDGRRVEVPSARTMEQVRRILSVTGPRS